MGRVDVVCVYERMGGGKGGVDGVFGGDIFVFSNICRYHKQTLKLKRRHKVLRLGYKPATPKPVMGRRWTRLNFVIRF